MTRCNHQVRFCGVYRRVLYERTELRTILTRDNRGFLHVGNSKRTLNAKYRVLKYVVYTVFVTMQCKGPNLSFNFSVFLHCIVDMRYIIVIILRYYNITSYDRVKDVHGIRIVRPFNYTHDELKIKFKNSKI